MTQTAVAAKVHQAFHIQLLFAPKVTFNHVVGVDMLTDRQNLCVREFVDAAGHVDTGRLADRLSGSVANAMNISKCDVHSFVCRNVYASDARHNLAPFLGPSAILSRAVGTRFASPR